jgi:WD40 repeat protein
VESAGLAVALEAGLERFAKPWYRLRAVRVFRDDSDLSANPDLRGSIEAGLLRSGWFILLASPMAAQSPWVESEVQWWLTHRSVDRIMLVQAAGEIHWDPVENRFDLPGSSGIPPILERAYRREPRWIDMRWFSAPESQGVADPRFIERVADLAAPIHGRERSDIVGEDVRQHRRTVRLARGAIATLTILLALSLLATVLAFSERRTAINQARVATARALASAAVANLGKRLDVAQLLAAEAYRLDPGSQSRAALFQAMTASPALVRYLQAGTEVSRVAASADGTVVVAGTADGRVLRWSQDKTDRRQVADLQGGVRSLSVSADGATIAAADDSSAILWSAISGMRRIEVPAGDADPLVAVMPSGALTVVHSSITNAPDVSDDVPGHLTVVDTVADTVRTAGTIDRSWWSQITAPSDSEVVLFNGDYGSWERRSVPALTRSGRGTVGFGVHDYAAAISPDGRLITYTNGADWLPLWRTREPTHSVTDHQREAASVGPAPTALAISPDGKRAATASNGTIHIASIVAVGQKRGDVVALEGNASVNADAMTFAGDADHLISATGSSVALWDLRQLSRIGRRTTASVLSPCGGCEPVDVAVDQGATAVAVAGGNGTDVAGIDGTNLGVYGFDHRGGVRTIGFTQGRGVAAWTPDDRLVVRGPSIDPSPNMPALALRVGSGSSFTKAIGVSTDGRRVVVVDGGNVVETHDATTGELLQSQAAHPDADPEEEPEPGEASIRADGVLAAVITTDGVSVISTKTGEETVVAASNGEARTAAGGAFLAAVRVAFVGNLLAVQPNDDLNVVELWDVGAGRIVRTITNDPETVGPFAINRQDTLFAQYRNDGTVVLQDSRTGATVGSIAVHPRTIGLKVSLAFSGDGDSIVTAVEGESDVGFPGELQQWRVSPHEWMRLACTTAGRNLTTAEWKEYAGTKPPTDLACTRP